MRLRQLSEAECYARIYGGHGDERVSFVRVLTRRSRRSTQTGEQLRELFEERLDERGPEAEAA
jgi:ribosomal protein S4